MPHGTPLITTLVAGFVLAFVLGAAAHRLRLPPLVGYLVAGVLVGPYTPGFVADQSLAPQLAEIGVILLMFGVGLHFSLCDLLNARGIAVPGAIVQIAAANPSVFQLANPGGAKSLIVAIPDAFEAGQIAPNARKANPKILIIARAHSDAEVEHLIKHAADMVIMGEREIALAMIEWIQKA